MLTHPIEVLDSLLWLQAPVVTGRNVVKNGVADPAQDELDAVGPPVVPVSRDDMLDVVDGSLVQGTVGGADDSMESSSEPIVVIVIVVGNIVVLLLLLDSLVVADPVNLGVKRVERGEGAHIWMRFQCATVSCVTNNVSS